jgi:crossover junction endodeoxyribonuclease RuvC
MIILGIDPGFAIVGYGLIEKRKKGDKPILLDYGCILTSSKQDFSDRIIEVYTQLKKIIHEYRPEVMAIETLFFARNTKTALNVSKMTGVILLLARQEGLKVVEVRPNEVKQSLTGFGRADKKQMQRMIQIIFRLDELPTPDDAADALAVALAIC